MSNFFGQNLHSCLITCYLIHPIFFSLSSTRGILKIKMLLVRSFHFLFSPLGWKGGAALFAFLSDFDPHLSLSCY